jgi:hypothetical protein
MRSWPATKKISRTAAMILSEQSFGELLLTTGMLW